MQLGLDLGDSVAGTEKLCLGEINPQDYDAVIVAFSGGKDSIACVLHLIEQGVRPELWHHDVDGKGPNFFDWPCTPGYIKGFAEHLNLPLYHSWRDGGLEGEMTKENDRTKAVYYETPGGLRSAGGKTGKISTRRKWPAVSADLRVRWCSSVGKIDVFSAAIAGQERFKGKKVLVVTGERREESTARSRYLESELHRSHAAGPRARRVVHHWRPIIDWPEKQVWDIIARHGIVPHPSYRLGFGRTSCMICIFSSARQAAAVRQLDPARFEKVRHYEESFGHTIRSDMNWSALADSAKELNFDPAIAALALDNDYKEPAWTSIWQMPAGAFGESCGPS